MAVNFPSNPTNGQTVTVSGITYAYDSTQGVWSDSPQGLTQAIDALTDVDTSTSAPTNGQVLQWNSTDSEWQPADSSAGVTVYATIDDLPLTGVTEGSMALVDSTDKLYIFSDAGWYSITLVNTTPSISGVSATYTLATDGTATTVTVTATDAEGIPLTYSIVSDTSGNIATVTQGTGSNTNQWTITPSTNAANGGDFTLVFRASDGVNVASASSTFSLVFSVLNSNYTTALITSVGANNAVNNSFDDASTNNHTITASGNVTQGTFSPYRHGGNAVSFAGTNSSSQNYLWINAAIVPATGSWTYESWVRVDKKSDGERHSLISWYTNGVSGRGNIFVRADNETNPGIVFVYVDGMSAYPQSTTRVDDGAWHHVVVERDGNVWSVWVDGTREDQETQNVTLNTSVNTRLGHIINTSATSHSAFKGLMRDVRFSTSAKYSGASTISVPTEDESTTTGYALLCCQSFDPFTDKTGNREITVYSSTSIEQVGAGPYDHKGYSTGDNGGSIFVGSGGYLDVGGTSDFTFGTGDFTLEAWVYVADASSTGRIFNVGPAQAGSFSLYMKSNSGQFQCTRYGDAAGAGTTTNSYPRNTWLHVRSVRSGGTAKLFVNGIEDTGATYSMGNVTATNVAEIGRTWQSAATGDIYIADLRVEVGTAISTSNFIPPTSPVSALTNTDLLMSGTNAGIIDKSQSVKSITLNGDVKSSTTQSKYLTSSMYFDGTGDYLSCGALGHNFNVGQNTIEMWIYPTNVSSNEPALFEFYTDDGNNFRLQIYTGGGYSGDLRLLTRAGSGSNNIETAGASVVSANSWQHIACVRNSSNYWDVYVDGTKVITGNFAHSFDTTNVDFRVGKVEYGTDRYFEGYMSDVRITKGLARYTASDETANIPSAALEG